MKARTVVSGFLICFTAGCGAGTPQNEAVRAEAVLALGPLTTTSPEARQELADGVREFDMARTEEAYVHFQRAIAADPAFAMAELYASQAAQSLPDAYAHIAKAVQLGSQASEVERLQIQSRKKSLEGADAEAALLLQQAVKLESGNARLWATLGLARMTLAEHAAARAALDSAIARGPDFEPAYIMKSVEYSLYAPYDFKKSEASARKAVELAPNESDPHDFLGDALRAQGKLEQAGQEYTKCAELDPTLGGCLQQRGHVNTFLGRYAEARADYDAAVALATGNTKPGLGAYRAFVHVFEGNPQGAIDELEALYESVDGMNIPEPIGVKIQVDSQMMAIAEHNGMVKEAERSVRRRAQLAKVRLNELKSPEFEQVVQAGILLDAGFLALSKGDYATATAQAKQLLQLRAANPTAGRPGHDLLAMIALKQKRYADAVREFAQGNSDHIYMNYWHAVALEALGKQVEAQQLYQKVASFYFNNVGVGLVRKQALAKVKGATA